MLGALRNDSETAGMDDRDPVALWRGRAMKVYCRTLAAVHLVGVPVALLTHISLVHKAAALAALALSLATAGLDRRSLVLRGLLIVAIMWIWAAAMLDRTGIFHGFRLVLLAAPIGVTVLAGPRVGLTIGALNLLAIMAASFATELGLLPDSPPAWLPGEWVIHATAVTGIWAPKFVLLAWFSGDLTASIRREHLVSAQLRREAADRERLEGEVLDVGERERRRVGHELHDGVCQDLTGALLHARRIEKSLMADGRPEVAALAAMTATIGDAIHDVHDLSRELSPGPLMGRDLGEALRDLVRRTAETVEIDLRLRLEGESRSTNAGAALHLYRIAQEALSNAVRHARASSIEVSLWHEGGSLCLRVEDDGRGLPPEAEGGAGMGLRTMRWRAVQAGGDLTVGAGASGTSTRIQCRVPSDEREAS